MMMQQLIASRYPGHAHVMLNQMVDSIIPTTREFWRRRYYDATDAEATDPRPFAEVLKDRSSDRSQ